MNPANYREAMIEVREDEAEGADILLVSIVLISNCECTRSVAEIPIILKLLQLGYR